jgi:hypothetical protein
VPANTTSPTLFSVSFSTSGHMFSANQRLRVRFAAGAGGLRVLWDGAYNTSRLQVPGLSVPESAVGLAGVGLLIPLAVAALRRRHARPLSRGTRGGRDRG